MPKSKKRRKPRFREMRSHKAVVPNEKILSMNNTLKALDKVEERLRSSTPVPAEDKRPCKGRNSNICTAEGCSLQSCLENKE